MADTNETIADIIAEMRRNFADGNPYYAAGLPDRLEAAHKRELSKNVSKNRADFGQLGNAAKLREALAYLFTLIDMRKLVLDCDETEEISAVQVMLDECRAALAAPPRNCDKYATADEALKAQEQMFNDSNFANGECKLGCPECDNPRVGCKIAWLFAPATEKEGGAK